MTNRIAVDSDVLRAHAARVDAVGSEVVLAASAVAGLDLAGGAFGVLCGFLAAPATLASVAGEQVIGSAGRMVTRAGVQVRGWAGDADAVEQAAVDVVATLRRALDAL